jgi:hypothetical protein
MDRISGLSGGRFLPIRESGFEETRSPPDASQPGQGCISIDCAAGRRHVEKRPTAGPCTASALHCLYDEPFSIWSALLNETEIDGMVDVKTVAFALRMRSTGNRTA